MKVDGPVDGVIGDMIILLFDILIKKSSKSFVN